MSNVTVQTFIVRVECNKPIPHLIDLVAGRTYTVDGVKDVTATRAEPVSVAQDDLHTTLYKPA